MGKLGIIHVGLPKTGTSTIQSALYESRQRLLVDHAILYPDVARNHTDPLNTIFLADPREHIQIMCLGSETEVEITRAKHKKKFEACVTKIKADWNTLLISAEGLSNFNPGQLGMLKEWTGQYVDSWKILFWVRHPVQFTTSNVQQMIRGGYTLEGLDIKEAMPCFRGRLENLIQVFGKDAIQIEVFENAIQRPGGIVAAFCRQLGIDETEAKIIASQTVLRNEGMSYAAAMAINRLNLRRPLFINGVINPKRSLDEANLLSRLPGPKFELSVDVREVVRCSSRKDVDWLNRNFGLNVYTDVFEANAKRSEQPVGIPMESIDALVIAISDLMGRVQGAEKTSVDKCQPRFGRKLRHWLSSYLALRN